MHLTPAAIFMALCLLSPAAVLMGHRCTRITLAVIIPVFCLCSVFRVMGCAAPPRSCSWRGVSQALL